MSFSKFRDGGGLGIVCVQQLFLFFVRPGFAVIGGETGGDATALWLRAHGDWRRRLRGWPLGFLGRRSGLGVLPGRKVRNEMLNLFTKTVEIGRDGIGLESIWMSGGITNDGNHSDDANQDGRQSVRQTIESRMKPPVGRCRVVLP